jgi:hypothetical protein
VVDIFLKATALPAPLRDPATPQRRKDFTGGLKQNQAKSHPLSIKQSGGVEMKLLVFAFCLAVVSLFFSRNPCF